MKPFDSAVVLLSASICMVSADHAQGQAEPPERWRVDYGDVYCTMARTIQTSQTTLLVRTIPGTTISELLLASRAWNELPLRAGETVSVQIGDSVPVETDAGALRLDSGTLTIGFHQIPNDYLERLAAGGEIRVTRGGEVAVRVPFPSAANAVTAIRDCVDQRLTAWGVDTRARASLRQVAEPIRGRSSTVVNPVNRVFIGDAGAIIVRATVDPRGRLSGCQVVRAIGRPMLKRSICSGFVANARYQPAVGADGRPAASTIIDVLVTSR